MDVRPARRWHHATTALDDFALITWACEPDRVQRHLPDGFVVDTWADQALVSMVPFLDRDFRFRGAPWPTLSCGQVNLRTYVRRGTARGVWFFGTLLDSWLVAVPRRVWAMPWRRADVTITATWDGDHCLSYRFDGGAHAEATLTGTGRRLAPPTGFADAAEASGLVWDPTVGWFRRTRGGHTGRYTVWHEPLDLEEATVDHARCQSFETLDLIDPAQPAAWAGVRRTIEFDVHTPPRRLAVDALGVRVTGG